LSQKLLKKIDILIRDNSKATKEDVQKFLKKLFKKIAKLSNEEVEYIGYATVFDARDNTYIWYYSDRAKEVYKIKYSEYIVVPAGVVTKKNFIKIFMDNISPIVAALKKYFVYGKYYIKTVTTKISQDNKIDISDIDIQGDIVNDSALVVVKEQNNNKIFEEFIVNIDGNTIIVESKDDLEGLEAIFTCMVKSP
jgi:hypothetical protein